MTISERKANGEQVQGHGERKPKGWNRKYRYEALSETATGHWYIDQYGQQICIPKPEAK